MNVMNVQSFWKSLNLKSGLFPLEENTLALVIGSDKSEVQWQYVLKCQLKVPFCLFCFVLFTCHLSSFQNRKRSNWHPSLSPYELCSLLNPKLVVFCYSSATHLLYLYYSAIHLLLFSVFHFEIQFLPLNTFSYTFSCLKWNEGNQKSTFKGSI